MGAAMLGRDSEALAPLGHLSSLGTPEWGI